ncbi:hypothetical protein FG386_000478, partial [Cryptosporidium ryanae]|uniref:uncharacterized protein n=1 Tax=Cryptosporidium ryanae TaxID=515981 RepID=UPI00351A5412
MRLSSSAIAILAIILNPFYVFAFKSSNQMEMQIASSGSVAKGSFVAPPIPSDMDIDTFMLVDSKGKLFDQYTGIHSGASTISEAFIAPFELDISGVPIEPNSRLMIDPISLLLFDNSTNQIVNPSTNAVLEGSIAGIRSGSCSLVELNMTSTTGFSLDESMNWQVSINSGELKDPSSKNTIVGSRSCAWKHGYSIDSTTGFRIDANTGLPTDPYSNCPFNPVTGNLVNRVTGKQIKNSY